MRLAKYMLAAAVASVSVAPAMAAPVNPASSLSVSRAAAPSAKKNELAGGGVIVAIVAAAAVIAGIVVVATDGDDTPDSN